MTRPASRRKVFGGLSVLLVACLVFVSATPVGLAASASKVWTPDRVVNQANSLIGLSGSITDSSNNVLTLYTELGLGFNRYVCVVKYNSSGTQLAQRCTLLSVGTDWEFLAWVPDGLNGGYASWRSSFGVTVARIDSALNIVWQQTDSELRSPSSKEHLVRTSDGDVVAIGSGSGTNDDRMYGAKLSRATGTAVWSYSWQDLARPQSILAFVNTAVHRLTAGPNGDVYIFSASNNAGSGYRGQHIDSAGVKTWGSNGILFPSAEAGTAIIAATTDNDGLPVVAIGHRASNNAGTPFRLYLQKYNAAGATQWGSQGTLIADDMIDFVGAALVRSVPGGGIMVGVIEEPSTYRAYFVASNGTLSWSQPATLATTAHVFSFDHFEMTVDATGSGLLSWRDKRSNPNCESSGTCEVYVQRVNRCGDIEWDQNGFRVAGNVFREVSVASDGGTGAYVSWALNTSIGTQRVDGPTTSGQCLPSGNFTIYDGVLQIRNNSDTLEFGNVGRDIASTSSIYLNPFFSTTAVSFFAVDATSGTQRLVLDAAASGVNALTTRANNANSAFYAQQSAVGLAGSFSGNVLVNGVVTVGGSKNAKLQTSRGDTYFHAIESPDVRFEDFGRATTRQNKAVIHLDSTFLETVSGPYTVSLTPEGKLAQLTVSQQSEKSFTVTSNIDVSFSYRVSALRKGFENQRFSLSAKLP